MEGLSLNNILTGDEVDTLFDKYTESEDNTAEPQQQEQEESVNEESVEEQDNQDTTEVNIDDIFEPESVGSEDDTQGDKEDTDSSENGTSPNFYSSIAKALKDEGIFPDLDNNEVKDANSFKDLIQKTIDDRLDATQKRINEALNVGIPADDVRAYENTLRGLKSVTDEQLEEEDEQAENLRKQLIYQDFINRGYSQQRATKEVNKSINAGTDIEDAKDALQSNIEFFQQQYDGKVNEAKIKVEEYRKAEQAEFDKMSKSILEDSKAFGDVTVDKATRKKILDNIAKPIYTDPKTGQQFSAVQKYQMENKTDFIKNVALVYTLTNGFTDFNGLLKGKVKKEVNKGLRELEHKLRGDSSKSFGGSLKLMNESPETSFRGWDIDL